MMNKPMMGQQPAPAAPTGMSFQSDPGMRSQFKGFMSGMAARNMPAPQPQPAMMMPQVPSQLANVDVFQPVMGFARGGGVPGDRSGGMGGYGGEARGSQYSGGVRESGGRQSYSADDISFGNQDDGGSDPVMAALDRALASTAAQNFNDIIGQQAALNMTDRTARQSGLDATPNVQTAGDALSRQMAAIEARSPIEQASIASITPVSGIAPDMVYDFDTSDAPDLLQNFGTGDPEIAQDIRGEIADIIAKNQNAAQTQSLVADAIADRGIATPMDASEFAGANIEVRSPDDIIREQRRGPSGPPQVGDLGAMGEGAFPSAPQMESVLDRAARKDDMSGARELVQRGFGAGKTPMEQLQARSEREIFDTDEMVPGIGAALAGLANRMGQGQSKALMERIQAGGIPEYDSTGQIVGAYMPGGGLFGSTVFFGPEEFRNDARMRQISKDFAEQGRAGSDYRGAAGGSQEDDAGFDFLKMLGFKRG